MSQFFSTASIPVQEHRRFSSTLHCPGLVLYSEPLQQSDFGDLTHSWYKSQQSLCQPYFWKLFVMES